MTTEHKRDSNKAWRRANLDKVKASNEAWRKANPDKVKASKEAWAKANPDKVKASARKSYLKHHENRVAKMRIHSRASYLKHRERTLAEQRAKYAALSKEDRRKYYGKKSTEAGKRWYHRNREAANATSRAWYNANLEKILWHAAKRRAVRLGLPFDIEPSDIVIPERCPVFGVEFTRAVGAGSKPTSPTLDRIHPEMGYVRGNIAVISKWANDVKSYGTAAEHRRVAEWMDETG